MSNANSLIDPKGIVQLIGIILLIIFLVAILGLLADKTDDPIAKKVVENTQRSYGTILWAVILISSIGGVIGLIVFLKQEFGGVI